MTNASDVIEQLKKAANPKNAAGMARFGINANNALGVSLPNLRQLAKQLGKSHVLAEELWKSGIHEARILASIVDDAKQVTSKQMDAWVREFDSWDVCDQVCLNLFDKTPFAYSKALKWAREPKEFVRRAGFALMACLAVHDKSAKDKDFIQFFPLIKQQAIDDRNFVRKAVNWALRQIGKRNDNLKKKALALSKDILKLETKTAKWIANDAIRELSKR